MQYVARIRDDDVYALPGAFPGRQRPAGVNKRESERNDPISRQDCVIEVSATVTVQARHAEKAEKRSTSGTEPIDEPEQYVSAESGAVGSRPKILRPAQLPTPPYKNINAAKFRTKAAAATGPQPVWFSARWCSFFANQPRGISQPWRVEFREERVTNIERLSGQSTIGRKDIIRCRFAQLSTTRASAILTLLCFAAGLAGWILYSWAFRGDPGQDWMVFYTAARAYLDGDPRLIFDGAQFTAALNHRFATWLSFPLNLHPWVYPPTFLLLFIPFGMLPATLSFILFLLTGLFALLAASWIYGGRRQTGPIHILSLLLCPATPFNVMTGQNAFFTSALLLSGLGLLRKHPVLGGISLGVVSFKPQLWIMVPVALTAGRQWRSLVSAGVTALILALTSLALFGREAWDEWLALATGVGGLYRDWLAAGRLNGQSVFACVTLLGETPGLANLAQWGAISIAAGCVYGGFRQRSAFELQLSVLLAATILAAPHVSASDAVLLALAASMFLSAVIVSDVQRRFGRVAIALAIWISPLFNPPSLFPVGLMTPIFIIIFLAAVTTMIQAGRRSPQIES